MVYYWLSDDQTTETDTEYFGTGSGNLTFSGSMVTATTTGGEFTGTGGAQDSRWERSWITITGQPFAPNNGTFRLVNWVGTNQVQWRNAAGGAEPFVGNWHLWGKCSQVTERLAGKVFTANSVADMTGWWCFTQSGKGMADGIKLLNITDTPTRKAMILNDPTLAGSFNGSTNFTLGGYYYMPSGYPVTTAAAYQSFSFSSDYTGNLSYIRLRTISTGTGIQLLIRDNALNTDTMSGTVVAAPTSAFAFICLTYNYATRTTEFFVDGVSVGTVADTFGTAPVPNGLNFAILGEETGSTGEREIWCRGQFACTGLKSSAEQLQLKAWYDNPTPP